MPESILLPDDMQADQKGRLTCATCHGIEQIEDRAADEIDTDSADFLRGGPYPKLTTFCFRCHDASAYQRLNIHLQLDLQGEIEHNTCEYCHREVPERKGTLKRDELQLRLPVERICLGCHLRTPHLNALEHSSRPDEHYQQRMAETERREQIRLPLDSAQRITCITCHTPHQTGVLSDDRPGGVQVAERSVQDGPEYRESRWQAIFSEDKRDRLERLNNQPDHTTYDLFYRRLAGEVLMRLSAKDGTLCKACHQFKD